METFRLILGSIFFLLFVIGYIESIYSQIYYERIIDFTSIFTPLILLSVWVYVKFEDKIRRRD